MASRRFADELSDLPARLARELDVRPPHSGTRSTHWPACCLCGSVESDIPVTGCCRRRTCNPIVETWRSYRVDLAGQPVYHGEDWIPVSQLPARRYG
jgi:hypothetical protein